MPDSATQSYKPHVLVDTKDLPESDWLEYRRRGLGGSDAASILGVSPFRTARDLYYDKLKIVTYEDPEDNWVQKKMGHVLEDLVAEIFHVRTGYHIYQVKKMFYHPLYPFTEPIPIEPKKLAEMLCLAVRQMTDDEGHCDWWVQCVLDISVDDYQYIYNYLPQ